MTAVPVTERAKEWLTEEGLKKVYDWAYSGLIEEDIAYNMGISRSTLMNWKRDYPQLKETIDEGKRPADERVESALYRRALGYDHTEKYYEMVAVIDENGIPTGKRKRVLVREVEKHLPGDVKAMMNWLKNRQPERWKDGQFTVEVNTDTESSNKLSTILGQLMGGEDYKPIDAIDVEVKDVDDNAPE